MENKIEQAFDLVNNINFTAYIDLLKDRQTPMLIEYFFGEGVPVPNKELIFEAKKQALNNFSIKSIDDFTKYPDPKHRLIYHLGLLAHVLKHNEAKIIDYRRGWPAVLDMAEIGHIWAYCEIFLKYYAVLKEYDNPKHPEPVKQANESITLEQMFAPEKLKYIITRLKEKNFITETANGYQWQGIDMPEAKGKGKQLVALAYHCQNKGYYKKSRYQQKEIHAAWTAYFKHKISPNMFSEVNTPNQNYYSLFSNL